MPKWTITVQLSKEGEQLLTALAQRTPGTDGRVAYVLQDLAQSQIDKRVRQLTEAARAEKGGV